MPRGNDSQAALVDLQGQFAGASGNAEQLIASARLTVTPELRTAMLAPRNDDATQDLVANDGLDDVQKHVDEGTVIDAAVRGDFVVAVVEVDSGRTFKVPIERTKLGGPEPRRAVKVDQAEADVVESQIASLRNLALAQKAAEEAEKKAEEARQAFLQEQAKAREQANDPKAEAKAEAKKNS